MFNLLLHVLSLQDMTGSKPVNGLSTLSWGIPGDFGVDPGIGSV